MKKYEGNHNYWRVINDVVPDLFGSGAPISPGAENQVYWDTDPGGGQYQYTGGVWVLKKAFPAGGGGGSVAWGGITGTLSSQIDLQNALNAKEPLKGSDDNYVTDAEKVVISNTSGTNTGDQNLSGYAPLASPTFTGTVSGIDKTMVGLSNVDNTSDANKPVSTATQTALNLKANLANPTFTGTVGGITKSMVGLNLVDNVPDASKPVSTMQQTALDLKANLASPALTGVPTVPTASNGTNTTQAASTAFVIANAGGGTVTSVNGDSGPVIVLDSDDISDIGKINKYVTAAEKTILSNTAGANSGDNATNTQYSGLALSKENAITATTSADFWSGAKTFLNFASTVRGSVLTGLSLASATVISSTDTVLVAFGSLQKQISDAVTSIALKANLASPTFTGTVSGITSTMVGLGNVDNTSDVNKPVSTATQTALNLKANLASPTLTGTPTAPTASPATNNTQLATTAYADAISALKANLASPTFTGTPTLPTGTIATTQTAGDSTTALATTAFVTTADILKANLASPTFTGTPLSTTAAAGTNTTQIATTAFVFAERANALALTNKTINGSNNTITNIAQSSVTGLITDLGYKQDVLVSATNIKTINGTTLLGSGDLVVSGSNFANTDLTFTGDRTHDMGSNVLSMLNGHSLNYDLFGGSTVNVGDGGDNYSKSYTSQSESTLESRSDIPQRVKIGAYAQYGVQIKDNLGRYLFDISEDGILPPLDNTSDYLLGVTASTGKINTVAYGSGTYTPTVSNLVNLAKATFDELQYMRIGNVVTVSGRVNPEVSTGLVDSSFEIDIPFASDFQGEYNAGGSGTNGIISDTPMRISSETTNNTIVFSWKPVNSDSTSFNFSFTYLIIPF